MKVNLWFNLFKHNHNLIFFSMKNYLIILKISLRKMSHVDGNHTRTSQSDVIIKNLHKNNISFSENFLN